MASTCPRSPSSSLPTFTLGTVAAQVDLSSAPTLPTISSLVATGTPTYARTVTIQFGGVRGYTAARLFPLAADRPGEDLDAPTAYLDCSPFRR